MRSFAFLALGLATLVSPLMAMQAQKVMPLQIDYPPPPDTWEECANRATAVAIVRLVSRQTQVKQREISRDIVTRFTADVLEVLKDNAQFPLAGQIDIYRAGGTVDTPNGRVTYAEERFPQWVAGMKVVVFLTWQDTDAGYFSLLGPDGVYEIDEQTGKVRTYGIGRLARAQRDRPSAEMLADLRKRVKK